MLVYFDLLAVHRFVSRVALFLSDGFDLGSHLREMFVQKCKDLFGLFRFFCFFNLLGVTLAGFFIVLSNGWKCEQANKNESFN